MKTNAPYQVVVNAVNIVGKKYDGNISFNRLDEIGKKKKYVNFTLAAKSGLKGSRNSWTGRKMPKASWEVHGEVFDEILKSGDYHIDSMGKRISKAGGNWEEIKIGNAINPSYMSELSN